ncbi:hypothetical protein FTV88_1317 [Heliorestis convoluta]|uniref:Uncharacterized protein n=1 Tax=Heliorestis convoluta TaxID=356322 RepID=A0A5Q2MXK5_9FIRM|nr:hypothetical protein FTV88_1317 [Heliorestis convoluta]
MITQLPIVFAIGQNVVTTSKMYLGQALFIPGERTSDLSHRQLAAAHGVG